MEDQDARIQKIRRPERVRFRNLLFVSITEAGQIVWQKEVCPRDITIRSKTGVWGLKQRTRKVGEGDFKARPHKTEFFRIGPRIRRFCSRVPGTIAVLDGGNEFQMAIFKKAIARLIGWGVLQESQNGGWPTFTSA